MEQGTGLSGLKVLVVEDEPLIAMALVDMLTEFRLHRGWPRSKPQTGNAADGRGSRRWGGS